MTNDRTRAAIRTYMAAHHVNYTTAKRALATRLSASSRATPPPVGSRVKVDGASDRRRWWTVEAADQRYAIVTRQQDFHPAGTLVYSILDYHEGVRGPCDLTGQGWSSLTPAGCAELLGELQQGTVGLSHRNRLPLQVTAVETTHTAAG